MLEAWKFHENVLAVAPCGPNIKGLVRPDGHHSRPAEAAADRRRPQLLGRSCGCSCRRSARQSRSASLELLQLRRRCCRRRRLAAGRPIALSCPSGQYRHGPALARCRGGGQRCCVCSWGGYRCQHQSIFTTPRQAARCSRCHTPYLPGGGGSPRAR